jgi:hypothetical protein
LKYGVGFHAQQRHAKWIDCAPQRKSLSTDPGLLHGGRSNLRDQRRNSHEASKRKSTLAPSDESRAQ